MKRTTEEIIDNIERLNAQMSAALERVGAQLNILVEYETGSTVETVEGDN